MIYTERTILFLYPFLALCLSVSYSPLLFGCLSRELSCWLSLLVCLCICLWDWLSLCICLCLCLRVSVCLSSLMATLLPVRPYPQWRSYTHYNLLELKHICCGNPARGVVMLRHRSRLKQRKNWSYDTLMETIKPLKRALPKRYAHGHDAAAFPARQLLSARAWCQLAWALILPSERRRRPTSLTPWELRF